MATSSANLGLLWKECTVPDAVRAARRTGFAAVEYHWPYETHPETSAEELADVLREIRLPLLGINTRRGNVGAGEFGLSALTGRDAEARKAIDQALTYNQCNIIWG